MTGSTRSHLTGANRTKSFKKWLCVPAFLCICTVAGGCSTTPASSDCKEVREETRVSTVSTAEDVKNADNGVIVSFSTALNSDQFTKNHNIRLACEAINGVVVMPGEVFSFNEIVGPRVSEVGYMEARGVEYGKSVPSVGGGICQVSTTVYNMALLSGFEIVERNPHSRPASYVPRGRDAMVAWEISDIKWRNSIDVPVVIRASSDESRVIIGSEVAQWNDYELFFGSTNGLQDGEGLMGEEEFNSLYHDVDWKYWDHIELDPRLIEVVKPRPMSVPNELGKSTMPSHSEARDLLALGNEGYKVDLWRIWYLKDGSRVSELISNDFYEPVNAVVQ